MVSNKSEFKNENVGKDSRLLDKKKRIQNKTPTSWEEEDDLLLLHLKDIDKLGWKEISTHFNNRTSNACQFRWRRLKSGNLKNPPKSVSLFEKDLDIKNQNSINTRQKDKSKDDINSCDDYFESLKDESNKLTLNNEVFVKYDDNLTDALEGLNALFNLQTRTDDEEFDNLCYDSSENNKLIKNQNNYCEKKDFENSNIYDCNDDDYKKQINSSTFKNDFFSKDLNNSLSKITENKTDSSIYENFQKFYDNDIQSSNYKNTSLFYKKNIQNKQLLFYKLKSNSDLETNDSLKKKTNKLIASDSHSSINLSFEDPNISKISDLSHSKDKLSSEDDSPIASKRDLSDVCIDDIKNNLKTSILLNKENKNLNISESNQEIDCSNNILSLEIPWSMEEDELLINRRSKELSFLELSILLPQRTENEIWTRIHYLEALRDWRISPTSDKRKRCKLSVESDDADDFYDDDLIVNIVENEDEYKKRIKKYAHDEKNKEIIKEIQL